MNFRSKLIVLCLLLPLFANAQPSPHITTPKEAYGFNIGEDYHMANYRQLESYWKTLAQESDRMKLVSIGKTSDGRTQYMAILSSPENLKHLDRYREISSKLAHAEGLTEEHAKSLAHEGKAVIWIDGGLHASETVGAQQIIETVYQLVSRTDPETLRFLDDDIVLAVQDNPDGMDMVADWYNREPDPTKRKFEGYGLGLPMLWQKYAGHDNNRDFFMNNLSESTNISRILFREWFPQIMYNHHQAGPPGTVVFVPPFRDPFNYHYDPLIPIDIESVGMAIHSRFVAEDKPGSTMRSGATYSTWYNGGLRTVTYFHNEIGILTEIIGSPNPMQLPLIPSKQLPSNDLPDPVAPQTWHYRQSIEYEITANRAILDYASRNRETLLYNFYKMGRNSIERGNRDSWTATPQRISALEEAAKKEETAHPKRASDTSAGPGSASQAVAAELYDKVLHDPAKRDPRGYILSIDQPDFPTATKFVNALMKSGITVLQAKKDFETAGRHYRAGSYVIKCAQAFRPHILDMFEPQDHPNDFRYPGGPPNPPYDATGYTLAFEMGVHFDRVLDNFDGPFEPIATDLAVVPSGAIAGPAKAAGFLVSHQYNDSFILTNRLLKAGADIYWLEKAPAVDGMQPGTGSLWIPNTPKAKAVVEAATKELGLSAYALASKPSGAAYKLKPVRIALFDQYGGLMPSGWTRFLFEQFEFPYTVVHPQDLDAGDLKSKFDAIVFPDGAIGRPFTGAEGGMMRSSLNSRDPKPEEIPAEYRPWLGRVTGEKTVPELKAFLEAGGSIVTIGGATTLAEHLHLPLESVATEMGPQGKLIPLSHDKFYVPGSLLTMQVNDQNPIAYGMPSAVDVFFDNSPAFHLAADAGIHGVSTIGWFGEGNLLASGWAWGQAYLNHSAAALDASIGKGHLYLFGPEIAFRGQTHATFKLLFNSLLYAGASRS